MFDIKHSVIPWFLFSITQKQARKLQATLDGCKPKLRPPTDLLTGMKCRATRVAKKHIKKQFTLACFNFPSEIGQLSETQAKIHCSL